MSMLNRDEQKQAKVEEIKALIAEGRSPERASRVKIDVRLDKGGLCKVYLRRTLKQTRTSEGRFTTA